MKTTITALSLAMISAFSSAATVDTSQGVVGGVPIDISQAPYQVALVNQSGQQFCGGTLVASNYVITAAHCLWGISPGRVTVVAGKTRRSELSGGVQVSEIHKYPGFYDTKLGKDIAVLKLATNLNLSSSNISAIAYVTAADEAAGLTSPGTTATLTGWGSTRYQGSSPEYLQKVDMPIVSMQEAKDVFSSRYGINGLTADQLPTWETNKSACHGDSGGPLVVPKGNSVALAGVVSWGKDCADLAPSMFARVSSFDSWLKGIIGDTTDGKAPSVALVNPTNAQRFEPGQSIEIDAQASDSDGSVVLVRFYQNGQLLAEDKDYPYSYTWYGASESSYKLHAVAMDDDSLTTTSAIVTISVSSDDNNGCTGIDSWSSSTTYPRRGNKVSYEGNVYENKWWTQGENPEDSGQWGVWRLIGPCS